LSVPVSRSPPIPASVGGGRSLPSISRSFAVGSYVVFYRLRGDVVEIAAVLHGARDIERIMRE